MNPILVVSILVLYFGLLVSVSFFTSKANGNDGFFIGERQSPWYLVAFGMIGASLSGVTFLSVPGWVGNESNQFSYMQAVLGYFIGYLIITYILLPIYYKLNVVSIYEYLKDRFGLLSHKTGAVLFLISRVIGASVRLMLVAEVLQIILFDDWGIPFEATVSICIVLIWLYTNKGGIKTIVWTDTLQTAFMLISVCLTSYFIANTLPSNEGQNIIDQVSNGPYSKIFFFDNLNGPNHFLKHFFGGIFIAIGMTGLDQDMMQKNLSCKNLKDAQKNMISMASVLVIVNLIFLFLGALLYMYASSNSIPFDKPDMLFSAIAMDSNTPVFIGVLFLLGLIAAAYSSADSALTSLTTSIYIDLTPEKNKKPEKEVNTRRTIHVLVSILIVCVVLILHHFTNDSAIGLLMKFAGFTYGPLIGIFFFGILSSRSIKDKTIPIAGFLSILITFYLWYYSKGAPGVEKGAEGILGAYTFGFEIIILNAFLTFTLLLICSKNIKKS
jgi:SSS family solute:Na+ symporter